MLIYYIPCAGGMGNHLGAFISGMHQYFKYGLEKTHVIYVHSIPVNTGAFTFNDIFTHNNKIKFLEKPINTWATVLSHLPIKEKTDVPESINCNAKWYITKHPFNIDSGDKLDIEQVKQCHVKFNTNALPYNINEDFLKYILIGKKYFNLQLKKNILDKISNFVINNNINNNTLAIHYRGTDILQAGIHNKTVCGTYVLDSLNEKIKNKTFENCFILSEENSVEEYLKKKFNGCSYKKNTETVKFPGLENFDWFLSDECKEKTVKINGLDILIKNVKFGNLPVYPFNVYRSKEQVIDGIIDLGILCYCGESVSNMGNSSSYYRFKPILDLFLKN